MMKTLERLQTTLAVEASGFEWMFTQEFPETDLLNRIRSIVLLSPPKQLYQNNEVLQRELLTNKAFPALLKKLQPTMEGLPSKRLSIIITNMQAIGQRITNYPFHRIREVLSETKLADNAIVPFITSFEPEQEYRENIIYNLNAFCRHRDFFELSPAARALFCKPYLSGYINNSTDRSDNNLSTEVCEMLASDPALQEVAEFLFLHANETYLIVYELEKIKENPREALDRFQAIKALLGQAETMELFLERWCENCSFQELSVLPDRLAPLSSEEREQAMQSKSAYVSLLYGKALKGIDLTDLSDAEEDLIIYALSAGKRAFIRLIEENADAFLSLPESSLLLNKEFYTQYVNLNTLNAKNLKAFAKLTYGFKPRYGRDELKLNLDWLEKREYTFKEIKALYGLPRFYALFYNSLSIRRVDERLLTLRQIAKRRLLACLDTDEEVTALAAVLSEKPLYKRIREDFSHIHNIQASDIIRLLLIHEKAGHLIPQMRDRLDTALVMRNQDELKEFKNLEEVKQHLEQIDPSWNRLRTLMGFDEDFVERNREQIICFLIQDGAQIALTYYNNSDGSLSDSQRESFKRIVKAELMGEFSTLKYYRNDLALEVDYPVNDTQKTFWQKNTATETHGVSAAEYDDFYSTMLLGIQPQRTCLSYIDGQYRECLLSNFDTNKKILYAEIDGKTIGRAILRLTKGRFKDETPVKRTETLAFVDVEALPDENQSVYKNGSERLVLFLERPYTAGASPEVQDAVYEAFVRLAENKADELGAMLVLSQSYTGASERSKEAYTKTHLSLFISRSKAGKQYIDSLNGSAGISDEGSYRSNTFLIRRKDL